MKDFYTFVGSNANEIVVTDTDSYLKSKNKASKSITTDEGSNVNDENPKLFLMDETQKSFKCYVCSKSFATKQSLEVHGRTHSGEKPYECKTCKKTFS